MKLRKCINIEEQPSGFDEISTKSMVFFSDGKPKTYVKTLFCLSFIIFHLPELDGCAWGRLGVQWFVRLCFLFVMLPFFILLLHLFFSALLLLL